MMDDRLKMAEKTGFYLQKCSSKTHKMLRNRIAAREQDDLGWRGLPRADRGNHHGQWQPPWLARGDGYPGSSLLSRIASLTAFSWIAVLATACPFGSFWASLANFVYQRGLKIFLCSHDFTYKVEFCEHI